jgi:hypothetical protein
MTMTDRDALAREMADPFYKRNLWKAAEDTAMRHIAAARAEALEEAALKCEVEADHWKKNGSHGSAFASVACAYIIRGAALDPKS